MSAVCESSSSIAVLPECVDISDSTDDESHQEKRKSDAEEHSSSYTNKDMRKTHSFSRSRPKKDKKMDYDRPPRWFHKLVSARKMSENLIVQLNDVRLQLEIVTQERDDLLRRLDDQQMAGKF